VEGGGCISAVEFLPSTWKALGSISRKINKLNKNKKIMCTLVPAIYTGVWN
jgi:hypothetical protein